MRYDDLFDHVNLYLEIEIRQALLLYNAIYTKESSIDWHDIVELKKERKTKLARH